ncbi:tyrosine-type recombinase/integrase [Microvirga alba]|uniref:Site-specific integrase n=1 Tax=Microvirga alba TaxID=2791025 RepID=A0A931BUJ9_9HYPH|nr:site-specific integrase [Microvirga alba]MBF9235004.1 site-specific integrase [Microvirga alba]
MATIRKRGDKWQVQVRRNGSPSLSRSFFHKADAQAWARQVELEADRSDLGPNAAVLNNLTVGDLIRRYLNEVVPRKRSAKNETAVLKAFLRRDLADVPLSKITSAQFASYRDERLTVVKGATVRREFVILRHCFEVAKREWSIPLRANPLKAIKLPSDSRPRDRRLMVNDGEELLKALSTPSARYLRPILMLAIETGMRRGELLSIRWEDVDLAARTIRIMKTKNGHPRTIPLTPKAVEILSSMEWTDERVFPVTANAVRLAWERLRKRAGLEDIRLHDLRHEAVSRCFEYGLTVPEVALISGHRDPRMLSRYTHLRPEKVAKRLASLTKPTL